MLFPKGMDANEYALKVTAGSQEPGRAAEQSEWLGKGKPPERVTVEVIRLHRDEHRLQPVPPRRKPQEPAAKEKIERACFFFSR